ncbi:MarR family winged helix-turn-helix transcriptional regulator [Streptococcus downei]|mgnify:CR=1 FL=1|uniref:MarR family transcriptional regulator n=1 Tax=Streptococcus downei MFe28 TaxID=764290 RepID=A0A380JCX8_STRDO|nr:winged helix DNA-binding protein [Streptococcus downei]EFQ56985.1 transcriptional regulator, MarR family [Streptococcus downei F0415]SUN35649.1 MarR family transcriptional regulator [Streptococcus downei MFe28]
MSTYEAARFRYLFKSVENIVNKELINLLAPLHITPNQSEVLLVLQEFGPLSLKDLGDLLICEKKSPSRLVSSLIKKNLVIKEISDKDRRFSLLSLTSKGQTFVPKIMAIKTQYDKKLVEQGIDFKALSEPFKIFLSATPYEEKLKNRSMWDD